MAIQFVNNVDFNLNQAESIVIEKLGSDPTSDLVVGRIIFNTASDTLKQYVANAGSGSPGWVEVGGGVESVGLSMPAAFAVSNSPVTSTGTLTVVGAGAVSQYIDGTGALQTFPTIPTVPSNIVETIDTTNGTYINLTPTTATDGDVTVTADLSAVDGTSSTATRFLSKDNTWDIPSYTANTNETYTLPVAAGGTNSAILNLTAGGTGSGVKSTVTINGDSNTVKVTESTGNNGSITLDLQDDVEIAGDLSVGNNLTVDNNTILSGELEVYSVATFSSQVTIPVTPTAAASAASKSYVDSTLAGSGALIFQGGYNAATNTPDLDVSPSSSIKQGWTYAVTAAGSFFGEAVEDGDLLIAESDAPTTLAAWTVVQNNIGIATAGSTDGGTTKGIAGFNSAHFNITSNGWVSSDIYGGGSTLGIVPSGGGNTTFLRGDGSWVTPTDTNTQRAAGTGLSLLGNTINANVDGTQSVAANTSSSTASRTYKVQVDSGDNLVVNVPWVDTNTQTVTSVDEVAAGTSTGTPIVVNPTTGDVKIQSMAYDGGSDVGHVPAGGSSSTFLRGDGSWAVPVDTGALGDRVALTGGVQAGGLTTFTYAVTNSFAGASAIDVKCEVISAAGETVYASVTRSGANLIVEFTGNIADSAYEVLLTYVG